MRNIISHPPLKYTKLYYIEIHKIILWRCKPLHRRQKQHRSTQNVARSSSSSTANPSANSKINNLV